MLDIIDEEPVRAPDSSEISDKHNKLLPVSEMLGKAPPTYKFSSCEHSVLIKAWNRMQGIGRDKLRREFKQIYRNDPDVTLLSDYIE